MATPLASAEESSLSAPEPEAPGRVGVWVGRIVTGLLVVSPAIALGIAVPLLWGSAVTLFDVILAVVFYLVTGFGVTVGYHRLVRAHELPRQALAEDRARVGGFARRRGIGDELGRQSPASPSIQRPARRPAHAARSRHRDVGPRCAGFATRTSGGCSRPTRPPCERYAPDMLSDADMKIVGRLFPVFAVCSLALPFFIGWTVAGTLGGALTALLWAGLARMMLLHHVTWSVNSICHMFGTQPATQKDHSTNFAPLALISFGESWHNFHHAHPSSARHGALPHQVDISATLIRMFELAGVATHVRWPTDAQLALCRT